MSNAVGDDGMSDVAGDVVEEYASWKGWAPSDFGRYSKREVRYYGWHLRRLGLAAAGLRMLEIGFGNGGFLGWSRANGHAAMGVESNPELVARAKAAGFDAYAQVADIAPAERFDLIAAFDVLEHIPPDKAVGFLRQLRDRCAAGGRLLLRFPNGDSPFGLTNQNGDLTHVNAIGQHKLRQIAGLSGWRVFSMVDAPWWANVAHSRSPGSLLRSALREVFERVLCFMYYNRRMNLDPNMVAVLVPATVPASAAKTATR